MHSRILKLATILSALLPVAAVAQDGLDDAIYITAEQVEAVNATPGVDRQLRVVDLGEYQLAVGIVHRGPTQPRTSGGGGGRAADAAEMCGVAGTASGASARGIAHEATTETYLIVSGSGTLVTGGHIVSGRPSGPDSPVTTILNGPSCSGVIGGDFVSRFVEEGDIVIIPAGVPHGWSEIEDHVDYLSVRPDLDEVLESGYVHPVIEEMER